MKTATIFAAAMGLVLACVATMARADVDVPTDGSDGDLVVTSSATIDLGLATTGTWSDASTHAPGVAGNGIYDVAKWAVVFKYQSVKIHAGATLTFKNRAGNPPVVWLVAGDVVTSGTIDLSGKAGHPAGTRYFTDPGPGGFRGGLGYTSANQASGGMGPVGTQSGYGTYAGYYGNAMIMPLIGGSGGQGNNSGGQGGGSGGGAILIAAKQTVEIEGGGILANGTMISGQYGGSGGAIRIIGDTISGAGPIYAYGQLNGLIRLEATTFNNSGSVAPPPSSVVLASAPQIWPETTHPTATIVSIGGQAASSDPQSSLAGGHTDLSLSQTGATDVIVQTANVPTTSTVTVRVVPVLSNNFSVNASCVSGNSTSATWKATVTMPQGPATLQARVVLLP